MRGRKIWDRQEQQNLPCTMLSLTAAERATLSGDLKLAFQYQEHLSYITTAPGQVSLGDLNPRVSILLPVKWA